MTVLDLVVVLASLAGLVFLAGWLAKRHRTTTDYYLGGRHLPAWPLGLSLAANQVSAISLVGAPAFVALREGGGLLWLQYELAVPLAMAVLVVWGVPLLRRANGANVYEAVEDRLGMGARRVLAAFFLIGRVLGAGVILYTSAPVVEVLTGWGLLTSLLVVGSVAVAYTTLGGLVADVFSDVLQLGLFWGGTVVSSVFLAHLLGSGSESLLGLLSTIPRERVIPLDLAHHGLGDGVTFAFWPMLLGGLFLKVSYYGCDQTQAQRILAAPSTESARRALTVAALVRFPLVLTYCLFGLMLAALLAADADFAGSLAGRPPDALVSQFLVTFLPSGILGIAVAGILAAALSSIDSALNSLSAVTMEEFVADVGGGRKRLLAARATTLGWGVWAGLAAFWFSGSGNTVIELVNQVGSLLYGPILALFFLAWLRMPVRGRPPVLGAFAGVGVNMLLARLAPEVSWLWWNVTDCVATGGAAMGIGLLRGSSAPTVSAETPAGEETGGRLAWLLLLEFFVILFGLGALTLYL